ncbi:MAG: hypothetical protein ACWA6Y_05200 [Polaromonas sp.]
MTPRTMPRRASAALAACALVCVALAGCAGPSLFSGFGGFASSKPLFANSQLSAQQAGERLVPGKTTQAEVQALLGSATVIHFDSGQSVWVYRSTPPKAAHPGAEFVILFDRAGVVRKTRSRPADLED